jgi:glycosyltransferase involved in cell wall biosynthesis
MRTLLFLSRIHPTKAIDRLLHAWVELQSLHPEWQLVIAGGGEVNHVQDITALAKSLKLQRVQFSGGLYGQAKSRAYLDADLFVLPTHSENFGMVIAEALAHACPVVVSRGAPWSALEGEGCGWWVFNDVAALSLALDTAMRLPIEQRKRMGRAGRAWMERDFSWTSVTARMDASYRWTLEGGSPPVWLRVD